jgi:hypothetical protein
MKKPFKKVVPTLKGEPVFLYVSKCCNERATKTPCVKVDAKSSETQGLGTFRCGKCRKVCKINRSKNQLDKQDETVVQ